MRKSTVNIMFTCLTDLSLCFDNYPYCFWLHQF